MIYAFNNYGEYCTIKLLLVKLLESC